VLVVQGDQHNESRLATTVVAALTSNVDLARVPGNVLVPAALSGLSKDSVVNVSALATVDRGDLVDPAGAVPPHLMDQVDDGLRVLLAL
jgi:mRNA interferase MazF